MNGDTEKPDAGPDSVTAPAAAAIVTLDGIRAAAEVIRGAVVRTPLLPFGPLDPGDAYGRTRVWLKPESLQPIGAFKLRGAYYNVATLPPDRRAAGVVTHSSGNHAQGVARAARLLGVRAVIVMPSDAPSIKVERVREDGAEIVFVGPSSEERAERAAELARVHGLSMVAPYDDAATITGQGTIGLEIVEQIAAIDSIGTPGTPGTPGAGGGSAAGGGRRGSGGAPGAGAHATGADPSPLTVLVPIGGGGIAAGVALAVKSLRPDARVIGVEPALAADARDSLARGEIVTWPAEMVGRTIADGQRTTSIGQIPFAILSRYLDCVIAVSEDEIARAMVRGSREARLVLEPSGATTLAACLFHSEELPPGSRVVCVLSGGNVDPARYGELLARGVAAGG
jgi:threo-3-hydroxy-L-aspartate ammonia-lyase